MICSLRPATPTDLPLIAALIRELADYEKLSHEVRFEEGALAAHLFGVRPGAEVVIGEVDGPGDLAGPQGFALFFHNFSTFEGWPGICPEDLYVRPAARGVGVGHGVARASGRVGGGVGRIDCIGRGWWAASGGARADLGARVGGGCADIGVRAGGPCVESGGEAG